MRFQMKIKNRDSFVTRKKCLIWQPDFQLVHFAVES